MSRRRSPCVRASLGVPIGVARVLEGRAKQRQMGSNARSMVLSALAAAALSATGCSKNKEAGSVATDDASALKELSTALKPAADGFDDAQTTDCKTSRVRELGQTPALLVDVEVARAFVTGTPAPSRFPLAKGELVPTQDVQGLDATQLKRAGDDARYVLSAQLWGLYRLDELDLPAMGMAADQPKTFTPGKVSVSLNLIERATGETLCTVRFGAETPRTAKIVTNQAGEIVSGPADALREEARRVLERRLLALR